MQSSSVSVEVVLGLVTTVVTGLTSAVVYLFKLYYVDTKTALNDCHEQHKATKDEFQELLTEKENDCREELSKLSTVVYEKQDQISSLQSQVFELARNQVPNKPSI